MKKLLWTTAFAAVAAPLMAQIDPSQVVVTVDGVEVKAAEYYRRMEFLPGVGKQVGSALVVFPPGFLTLEQLITEKLVFELAKEKGVMPSEAEIQAEYKQELEDNPEALAQWEQTGQPKEGLIEKLKYDYAQFKILTAGVTITDQEVDKFYKDNPTMFTVPQRYKLRMIAVQTDAAQAAVDADLAAGKSFADAAKDHSEDISKSNGGDIGTSPIEAMPDYFRQPISMTAAGKATGWITIPDKNAKAKFFVESVVPAELKPIDAKLRRAIRKRMMVDQGSVKNNIDKEMAAIRAKAKIEIKNQKFADAYKSFVDNYLKHQSTGGG